MGGLALDARRSSPLYPHTASLLRSTFLRCTATALTGQDATVSRICALFFEGLEDVDGTQCSKISYAFALDLPVRFCLVGGGGGGGVDAFKACLAASAAAAAVAFSASLHAAQ